MLLSHLFFDRAPFGYARQVRRVPAFPLAGNLSAARPKPTPGWSREDSEKHGRLVKELDITIE